MSDQKIETLRSLLEDLICEKETRIDSFLAEDVEAYLDFAEGMGLKYKKPIYDVAEILYSYAAQNIADNTMELSVAV